VPIVPLGAKDRGKLRNQGRNASCGDRTPTENRDYDHGLSVDKDKDCQWRESWRSASRGDRCRCQSRADPLWSQIDSYGRYLQVRKGAKRSAQIHSRSTFITGSGSANLKGAVKAGALRFAHVSNLQILRSIDCFISK